MSDPLCRPPASSPPLNPPGRSSIAYRLGTFGSLRRAMLDEAAGAAALAPWHEGASGDYLTTLIELWAYLGDVLTFYQERIANEAYLGTATQRDSLRRLAALIDYAPAPGSGAGVLVAFTVAPNQAVSIPGGSRVGSRPAPPAPAAVFETTTALAARGEHSAIPLSVVAPTNQFAPIQHYDILVSTWVREFTVVDIVDAVDYLYGGAGRAYLSTVRASLGALRERRYWPGWGRIVISSQWDAQTSVQRAGIRRVVLQGANNNLAAGQWVLVVDNEGGGDAEQARPFALTGVEVDKKAGTTTISWQEAENVLYTQGAPRTVYALRVAAAPFGNNAPNWNGLPAVLQSGNNWDDPSNPWAYLPVPGEAPDLLFLDAVSSRIAGSAQVPGWAVLVADGVGPQVFHVTGVQTVSKAAYAISAKVTRLTLKESLPISPSPRFPLRGTTVLAGAEPLALQDDLPLSPLLAGDTLVLAGQFPHLQPGQAVLLQGTDADTGATTTEVAALDGPPQPDSDHGVTLVSLQKPLANVYTRAGAVLLANVVEATQGETVRDEALGSGDGSAFQTYSLKQGPLTYLPATDATGLAGVQSTLQVTVGGVRWDETRTLLESDPGATVYMTTTDDSGRTVVLFGGGAEGAAPPTGQDNVRARYRKGLGASGNVDAGGIAQILDALTGLQRVTNPLPAAGGMDPEDADGIRVNAPAALRTFGRAVSAPDYAALALGYPGVAKASAAWVHWVRRVDGTLQVIPQPYIRLTVALTAGGLLTDQPTLAAKLRAFLDGRRDPNVPLRLVDFTPVPLLVAATVNVQDQYPRQATLRLAQAALNPGPNPDGSAGFFAPARQNFGQSVVLGAVYAALQAVPGVSSATVTQLQRVDEGATPTTPHDILLQDTEMAVISGGPGGGALTLNLGTGGYADA